MNNKIADETKGEVKVLKIYRAKLYQPNEHIIQEGKEKRKEISLRRVGKSLVLDLENGSLELLEVQLEGKRRDSAKNYLFLAEKDE